MKPSFLTAEHHALAARARRDFTSMEPSAPLASPSVIVGHDHDGLCSGI